MTAEWVEGRLQQQLQKSSEKDGRGGRRRQGVKGRGRTVDRTKGRERKKMKKGYWGDEEEGGRGRSTARNETEGKRRKKKRWTRNQGKSKEVGVERKKSKRKGMIESKAESISMLIESTQVDAYQDGLIG